jgi:hypothetical protein
MAEGRVRQRVLLAAVSASIGAAVGVAAFVVGVLFGGSWFSSAPDAPGIPAQGSPRYERLDCGQFDAVVEFRKAVRSESIYEPTAIREVYTSEDIQGIGVAEQPRTFNNEQQFVSGVALWFTETGIAKLREAELRLRELAPSSYVSIHRVRVNGRELELGPARHLYDLGATTYPTEDGGFASTSSVAGLFFDDESRTYEQLKSHTRKLLKCE